MVNKISEKEFEMVLDNEVALVDFSAGWCGPCKMLAPVLEAVSEQYKDKVAFYNVDVDDNPGLAEKFEITNIPALVLLKKGVKADMQVGFVPQEIITDFIDRNM